jgi:hypothetical protein
MYPVSKGLMTAAMLFVMATPALAQAPSDQAASGDVTFSSESITSGSEYRRVEGTLRFKDKSYPFTVSGVRVAVPGGNPDNGAGDVFNQGTGKVYNLQRVEDFAGNFAPVKPGATLASEATTTTVENQHGVRLEFQTTATGTRIIEWPADGVLLSLK